MTAFWCSACKVSHAGTCPPQAGPPAGPTVAADPGGGSIDFDELVNAYLDLPVDEVKQHYLAAKNALLRLLGNGTTAP